MNGFETILPFLKPIEHLILDNSVSEVMINGPDTVFIERAGYLQPVSGVSLGERALLVAVKNIARRLGGDVSESHPILDSRLADGSRVAAVIPPCSLNGVTLTIRKFNTRHFEMQDLIAEGTLDQSLANRLEDYVLSRKNILICGGTGSGKTTTINILGKFIPEDERIVLIEDTAEIRLPHANAGFSNRIWYRTTTTPSTPPRPSFRWSGGSRTCHKNKRNPCNALWCASSAVIPLQPTRPACCASRIS